MVLFCLEKAALISPQCSDDSSNLCLFSSLNKAWVSFILAASTCGFYAASVYLSWENGLLWIPHTNSYDACSRWLAFRSRLPRLVGLVQYSVEKFKVERNKDIIHIKYQKKLWTLIYFPVMITDTNFTSKTIIGLFILFFFFLKKFYSPRTYYFDQKWK